MRWFDLMGLQRHIKVLGIFARLVLPRRQAAVPAGSAARAATTRETRRALSRDRANSREFIAARIEPQFAGGAEARARVSAALETSRSRARR